MSLLFAKQLMKMKVHVRLGFDKEVLILLCYPYLIYRRFELLHRMEFVHSSMPLHHLEGKMLPICSDQFVYSHCTLKNLYYIR